MIIYLNWIGGWLLLVRALATAATGAFGLVVDVCLLLLWVGTSTLLLLLALNDHTWVFLLVILRSATQALVLAAAVGHWVERFAWFQ